MSRAAAPDSSRSNYDRLLRPRSIAIIGASEKRGALGASVLENLEVLRFSGEIHLVNPKRSTINGRPCLASMDDLPEGIDCAVLAIPRKGVLDSVRACGRKGVGGVIIFSAGFAESGDAGKAEQQELARIARESGMIVEGPNCLGMVNAVDAVVLTFVATPKLEFRGPRGIAVISQSGAMAAVLGVAFRAHALELTYSISTGNEAVSGVEDFLEYLLADEKTAVFALLVEQFRNPKRFLELARRAVQAGKRIVLLHPGTSKAARASAATHTGAIAGDYQVMRAYVADAGVILVESLEEFVDVANLLLRCSVLPSGGTAVLTESGAFKALTLDLCERIGLRLPPLSETTTEAFRNSLPALILPTNPVDITAQGLVDPDVYRRALLPLLADEAFGSVVLTIILTDESTGRLKLPPILNAISSLKLTKPIIFAALDEGAWIDPAYVSRLRELGVPFFPTAERAFRAMARFNSVATKRAEPISLPNTTATRLSSGTIPEYMSKGILKSAGIPIPAGELAITVQAGLASAERIGYPIVLKAQAAKLSHKSDAGGVVLNLRDENEFEAGWDRLHANIAAAAPELKLDGVLVEKMCTRGVELIVGARNDPDWGPVLLVGMGGIFAEALKDVRILVPGISLQQIADELRSLKGAGLLAGYRGTPVVEIQAVAGIVHRLGELLLDHPEIREVDINPVVAFPQGQGAVALDALIFVD
jgi:acyl-CoA synthetase (NDP forming)